MATLRQYSGVVLDLRVLEQLRVDVEMYGIRARNNTVVLTIPPMTKVVSGWGHEDETWLPLPPLTVSRITTVSPVPRFPRAGKWRGPGRAGIEEIHPIHRAHTEWPGAHGPECCCVVVEASGVVLNQSGGEGGLLLVEECWSRGGM